MTHYFLFAGEMSGDLHGSLLMRALREKDSSITMAGVGGPRMRQMGLDCFLPMEHFQVMGFSDVIKALPKLWKYFYQIRDYILKTHPDCIILIDYPGFNLRLASALRKQGFRGKIVQYICPSVWAHGKKRMNVLNSCFDLLLTIYPFEADYFSESSLAVKYIGNPLVERIQTYSYLSQWKDNIGLSSSKNLIALFPGSRQSEIRNHVPQQLSAALQLKKQNPDIQFGLSYVHDQYKEFFYKEIQKSSLILNKDIFLIPSCYSYELMRECRTALAKSGTVTLELALHSVPTVVHYKASNMNYFIAKYWLGLNLPHYCIVNILGKSRIFPEIIGRLPSITELSEQLNLLHHDQTKRQAIIEACNLLKQSLGDYRSPEQAAGAIQGIFS